VLFILKRKFTSRIGKGPKIPDFLATHDSATGMVLALADFLKGKPYEGLGTVPTNESYATFINILPVSWRKKLYSWIGNFSAASVKKAGDIDASKIDKWIYDLYPKRKYPAIVIGSSNGAMIHLCAAMGIPWLPQTFLIPVDKEKKFPVDEPKKTMNWGIEPGNAFLKKNKEWQLHHMMDPNQDRLRVDDVGYFRIKKLKMGEWYTKFVEEQLAPGGKIIIVDCRYQWPVCKMGERHYFQFGGAGGLEPKEYYEGSAAVKEFLQRAGTGFEKWDAPVPDSLAPEAEWGLEQAFTDDFTHFAKKNNFKISRISFDHPQEVSAAVADIYKIWYREKSAASSRLLVESFNIISPYLSMKKHCIPYWLFFNVNFAAEDLETYLQYSENFEEIYMMILSHGKNSAGSTPISRWEEILQKAKKKGEFIGTNPKEYPVDLAVYARYSKDLKKKVPEKFSFPDPLDPDYACELLESLMKIKQI